MNILSIDASSKSSGFAIFENNKLTYHTCITASSKDVIARIKKMIEGLIEILKKYSIDKIILEEVRPENGLQNIQTHRVLMWLQAAIAFTVHDNFPQIKIEYLYPSEWRSACGIRTGKGIKREELKLEDIRFVEEKFNIKVNDDEADAIGIGYAYILLNNKIIWE
jgi:Holliday junction resolvasome RuvABC endonuclease subunit